MIPPLALRHPDSSPIGLPAVLCVNHTLGGSGAAAPRSLPVIARSVPLGITGV